MREIVISVGASSSRRRTWATAQPAKSPIAMPPAALPTNSSPASVSEKVPVTTAATAKR
jgi:hypothetical protein